MQRKDNTEIITTAFPIKFSETTPNYSNPPPNLGENTEEVLKTWLKK